MVRKYFFTALLLFIGIVITLSRPKPFMYSGNIMGTTFSIKAYKRFFISRDSLCLKIDQRFLELNSVFSTYDIESEISRFNQYSANKIFPISDDFRYVFEIGKKLYHETNGRWDATVKPLFDLWGFHGKKIPNSQPLKMDIEALKAFVGLYHIIQVSEGLMKDSSQVRLDLNSIAKGYAVDEVMRLLRTVGFKSAFVEIGGEIRTLGKKINGDPWVVGIHHPRETYKSDKEPLTLSLMNQSIASSGDYRHYFKVGDKRYSHIINPLTGVPAETAIIATTVVAKSCAYADGLATALMGMSLAEGLALLNRIEGVHGILFTQNNNDPVVIHYSSNFLEI